MGIYKLNKIVKNLIAVFVGILIGLLIWVGVTLSPPAEAETAHPLSPGSQCLSFNRFCEPKEDGGLCFQCTVI
jgi:hypothetical protein